MSIIIMSDTSKLRISQNTLTNATKLLSLCLIYQLLPYFLLSKNFSIILSNNVCLNIVNIMTILKQNVVVDYTYTFTLRWSGVRDGLGIDRLE